MSTGSRWGGWKPPESALKHRFEGEARRRTLRLLREPQGDQLRGRCGGLAEPCSAGAV